MFFAMPEDFTSLKKYPVYTLKIYPSVQSFPFHKQPPGSFPLCLLSAGAGSTVSRGSGSGACA